MKTKIIQFLIFSYYLFWEWVDKKRGLYQEYSYETMPYCGHHYSGHEGWVTGSAYHEGCGGCFTNGRFFRVFESNDSDIGWEIQFPFFRSLKKCVEIFKIYRRKNLISIRYWSVKSNSEKLFCIGFFTKRDQGRVTERQFKILYL